MQKLTNLRYLREHAALTQAETAERAGIAESTYRYIENLEVSPRPQTIRKIAGALEVEPHDLWESDVPKALAPTSSPREPDEARRPPVFDMVHELVTQQTEEDRQAIARAAESGRAQVSFVRHENEAMKRLLEYPPAEVAEAYVDLMRDIVQLERELQQSQVQLETDRSSVVEPEVHRDKRYLDALDGFFKDIETRRNLDRTSTE